MSSTSSPPAGQVPDSIERWAANHGYEVAELVWMGQTGDFTARLEADEKPGLHAKWSRDDLLDEAERLSWLSGRFPAPRVADLVEGNEEGSVLVTYTLPGTSAVLWKQDPAAAARAVAEGLASLHSLDPSECLFDAPDWIGAQRPGDGVVILHGDPCTPNTLMDDSGRFAGIVDVGELGVGDPWADLAIGSWALDWNFGPGYSDEFFTAYGVAPDPERIRRYREQWEK